MNGLILKNGLVFDPLNGIKGEKMDIMIKDGVIVEEVDEKKSKVIDVTDMIVVPGGIDSHTHIASQTLSIAKMMGINIPLPKQIEEEYLKTGYTFVVEAGMSFSKALHTHIVLERLRSLDKACLLRLDSNWLMIMLAQEKDLEASTNVMAWLLKGTKAYGVKLVNPLSSEAWTWRKEWKGASEKIKHLDISPLEYAKFVLTTLRKLNVPSPLYIHPDGAGQVGGFEEAIKCLNELKVEGKIHLAHAQYYAKGVEGEQVDELAEYVRTSENVEVDVGCAMLNEGILISHDAYFISNLYRQVLFLDQIEGEGVAFLARGRENIKSFLEASLKLILSVRELSKVHLSLNSPNCGTPSDYPHLYAWLMSEKARNSMDDTGLLAQFEDELTLEELFVITRGAPAASLGLNSKGRLSIGADADIAVYNFNPEVMDPSRDYEKLMKAFSKVAYTIKGGEIIVKNGEVIHGVNGKTFWIKCKGEPSEAIFTRMERYFSFDPKQYDLSDKALKGIYQCLEA